MAQLARIALGVSGVAALAFAVSQTAFADMSAARLLDSDPDTYDGEAYLCSAADPNLAGYGDVVGLNTYLTRLRQAEVSFDPSNCLSNRLQVFTMISGLENESEFNASLSGFLFAWVGRSRDMIDFETRYANDAELLLIAALTCDGSGAEREACLGTAITALPEPFLADSPVFCDFAPEGSRAPEAFGPAPDAALLAELPGICATLNGADAATASEAWWSDLETELFPTPAAGGN